MRQTTKQIALLLFPICLIFVSEWALGQGGSKDIAALSGKATTQIESVVTLIKLAAYVAGVGFALAGVLQFKAHKDNPQQTPLSKPVVMIIVSAALLFLPTVMDIAGGSLFEGGEKSKPAGKTA